MLTRLMLATMLLVLTCQAATAQFTFRQRNGRSAAQFGFGNSRFRVGITADQGSSLSTSMSAPTVTIPSFGTASFSNGTLRPFVTGFTPIVGRQGGWNQSGWDTVGQRQWSTARSQIDDRQAKREEARDSRRSRVIKKYQEKAEHEHRMGRVGAARMYYRMALKRATGDSRELIVAKLAELE